MISWDPQLFSQQAPPGVAPSVVLAAIDSAAALVDNRLPPIFTVGHLAEYTTVPHGFLRDVVRRSPATNPYRVFRLHKKGFRKGADGKRRYRWIAAPNPLLLRAQQWINHNVLAHLPVHSASYAYRKDRSACDAAKCHTKARWLIKVDVENFFESIREPQVYDVFFRAGYQPLVAFELARICTRIRTLDSAHPQDRFIGKKRLGKYSIYQSDYFGHLPQGAPTSPALANLVVEPMDVELAALAKRSGFRYTRYADDIAFSSKDNACSFQNARDVEQSIYAILKKHGFQPNMSKTQIRGPGARKLVLGLLVDGSEPRLTKEFRSTLTLHLRHLERNGPAAHAHEQGFQSIIGLRHHIEGLISYAHHIDKKFAATCWARLNHIVWPIFHEFDLTTLTFDDL